MCVCVARWGGGGGGGGGIPYNRLIQQQRTERQLTTARATQKTGLTNGRAANWAPEVEFSPFRAPSRRQMTFPFCR